MKKCILSAIAIFIALLSSAQCFLKEIQLDKRIAASELIIEGKVVAKHSFWNDDQTMIYTSNKVEILKIFKGNTSSGVIDILTVGGVVEYRMIKTNSLLSLELNQTGIFLCENIRHFRALPQAAPGIPRYEAYGSMQGFIKYDAQNLTAADPFKKYHDLKNNLYKLLSPTKPYKEIKPLTATNILQSPARRTAAITGFSPANISAGTGSVLTIDGSGFGNTQGSGFVEFSNADDGGATFIQPLASQYISWSNVQIKVEVPTGAGTGVINVVQGSTFTSATALTVNYAHLNVDFDPGSGTIAYQTDHVNDNGSGGYTWKMNTAFDANAAAKASFIRAFDTWRCGTNVNWEIGATTSINDAVSDGANVICFDDTAPLPGGTAGVCYSYWSGCATGPTIIWYVNELDMIFDDGSNIAPKTWQFGPAAPAVSEYDFESVAVHELGHGRQLGHVIDPADVMHYGLVAGTSLRSLSADDLAGGNFVQAKSEIANVCGPGAMTPYSGCILPLNITSINASQKNNGIQVQWINQSETGVDYYEIEESNDGIHFTVVATIQAKADNGSLVHYNWFDGEAVNGTNYYRIKTVTINRAKEYSTIVSARITNAVHAISVHPNPVTGKQFILEMNQLSQGIYTLSICNAAGQLVLNKKVQYFGNGNEIIHLPSVSPGVYSLKLEGNNQTLRQRIIIND